MFRDIATVVWRDWLVLKRRLPQFLLARMITPLLYLIAFGWGIGRATNMPTGGGSYLDYIVPGILALNSMNMSFAAVGSPLNMSRLYHKTLEEYLVAPISPLAITVGKILAGSVRALLSSLVIILIAFALGARLELNVQLLLVLILNCFVFAALAVVAAMSINSHEEMSNFNTFVLLPMSFLCATFFNPNQLPGAIKLIIDMLPLTHASYALRAAAVGDWPPAMSLVVMVGYATVLLIIGTRLIAKARD